MKKHDEGYALPFVLVVMVIICLVGISIMSSSLNNLQNQKASIERMQDQYAAAGKIEKVLAILQQNKSITSTIIEGACSTAGMPMESEEINFVSQVDTTRENKDENGEISFTLKTESGMVEIATDIVIKGTIKWTKLSDEDTISYDVSAAKYTYSSYEINIISEGGEIDAD